MMQKCNKKSFKMYWRVCWKFQKMMFIQVFPVKIEGENFTVESLQ